MHKVVVMENLSSGRIQIRVLLSSVLGTTMMTLYSYIRSWREGKNFKEPDLLAKMFQNLPEGVDDKQGPLTGWTMHYLVGLLFAESYAPFWSDESGTNSKRGLVFGGLSGIAAIMLWRFTLDVHPSAPKVDFKAFAVELFAAHVVFAVFAGIGYALTGKNLTRVGSQLNRTKPNPKQIG